MRSLENSRGLTGLRRLAAAFAGNRQGNIGVSFGLTLIPLAALIGAAVDFNHALRVRGKLQNALDASLVSAATNDDDTRMAAAKAFFGQNSKALEVYGPDASFHAADVGRIGGVATAEVATSFMRLVNINSLPVAARSSVVFNRDAGRACVVLLDPDASNAFRINSGADITAEECEVHVHSEANPAANFNAGISIDFKRICIKGSDILNNYGPIDGLETDCTPIADPYAGKLPEPPSASCDFSDLNFNGGSVHLTPGVYCGWVNFNSAPDVTFAPGVYVIRNGGWNVNGGTWTGTGVSFYFADTSMIQFNSAVEAHLTPPTDGDYMNLMFFEAEGLEQSNFVLDDSRGFEMSGIIYLPSRNTIYNSGSTIESRSLTMVFNTLILNQTKWDLVAGDEASGATAASAVDVRIVE